MRLKCDTGIQYALVRDRDPQTLKRQVEQQIRAAEDRNKVFLENAARRGHRCLHKFNTLRYQGKTRHVSSTAFAEL